jgi:hypothetical protein
MSHRMFYSQIRFLSNENINEINLSFFLFCSSNEIHYYGSFLEKKNSF